MLTMTLQVDDVHDQETKSKHPVKRKRPMPIRMQHLNKSVKALEGLVQEWSAVKVETTFDENGSWCQLSSPFHSAYLAYSMSIFELTINE